MRSEALDRGLLADQLPSLAELTTVADTAHTGSIGATARRLGLSQQAASQRIRAAEIRLGLTIFTRSPRGVALTPDGALVVAWIDEVLQAAGNLAVGVDGLVGAGTGRVAVSMTIAEYLLPGWLVTLRQRRPEVRITVRTANSTDVIAAVSAGTADVGFVEGPTVPPQLQARVVAHDELVVVVAPDHPWAESATTTLDELRRAAIVHRERGSGTRDTLVRAIPGLADPVLELDTTAAVKAAIGSGTAAAVLSRLAVARDVDDGRLVVVDVPDLDLSRELRVIRRPGQRLPSAVRTLLEIAPSATRR